MLVGSGGVIALVIGAWSVLWAVRATPGREPRSWYPVAAAFVVAMVSFALLTGQSELVLGLADWADAADDEKFDAADLALSYSIRPLLAPILGSVALAVAVFAVHTPTLPARPEPQGWLPAIAVGAMVVLTLFGLVDLWFMRSLFERYVAGHETAAVALPRLQFQEGVGAFAAFLALAVAAAVGGRAAWRARRAAPAA